MIYVNDVDDPTLLGRIQSNNDVEKLKGQIRKLNQELIDSGFEQYQFREVRRGNNLYIERINEGA